MSDDSNPHIGRPARNPKNKQIIQHSAGGNLMGGAYRCEPDPVRDAMAANIGELARNNRLIFSGALADGRGLRCHTGVYTVKVNDPLELTDEGICLDMHNPMFRINVLGTGSAVPELVVGLPYGITAGGSAGNGPGVSREDHMHAMILTTQVGVTCDLLNTGMTAGAAIVPARDDHVHFHGQPVLAGSTTQFYAPTAVEESPTIYFAVKEVDETFDGLNHMLITPGAEKKVPVTDSRTTYPAATHDLLDGVKHPDTVQGASTEGYLIVGNAATPSKWQVFQQGQANEHLAVQSDGSGLEWVTANKVKVSANDTTPDELDAKIVGDGTWTNIEEVNDGGDEDLKIKHIGPGAEAHSIEWNECDEQGNFRAKLTLSLDAKGHARSLKGEGPSA